MKNKLNVKDYKLPQDLDKYHLAIREFARTELEPIAEEIEATGKIPLDRLVTLLRDAGILTLMLPKEYGGIGLTLSQFWPIYVEVAKVSGTIRMFAHAYNGTGGHGIIHYGTKEQREKFLPYWTQGTKFFSFCNTEPNAGAGVDIKTTAKKVNGKWIINGEKHLLTWADNTDYYFVLAYTGDRSLGPKGISTLVIPKDTPGYTLESHKPMMGLIGNYHGMLHIKNCEIPEDSILGKEGEGLEQFYRALEPSRLMIATAALGHAERLLELSADFAKKRVTFGKPISDRQGIQELLADMATDIYAARSMIADCARRLDAGESVPKESAACKLFGLEMATRVSDKALVIHGGIGYTRAYPVERLYRDIRALWFEEGTPSIQRNVVARIVLGKTLSA